MRLSTLKLTTLASLAFIAGMTISVVPLPTTGSVSIGVEEAQARVGRPATATSVAGVARRTTRRTVRRGAVAAGVAAGAVAPRCGYYPYPACY